VPDVLSGCVFRQSRSLVELVPANQRLSKPNHLQRDTLSRSLNKQKMPGYLR
jgi:hypothetical protein